MMEKSLRPALSKPDVLAKICGVSVREIKTVVDDNLKVSDIKAHRKVYPSPGSGTANVAYDQQGLPSCRATVRFDFEQEDGMGRPSITNISVL